MPKGLLTRRNTSQEPFALHASCHLRAIPQHLMPNGTTQTAPVGGTPAVDLAPSRWVEAWPLVATRRATRHSRRRKRQAPPSPMSCSTRTRRCLDEPHRLSSASVAGEHVRPIVRSRTGSATTRLPPHWSMRPSSTPTVHRPPSALGPPASQIRTIRTIVRMLSDPCRGDATG
jgi:hypothetical protein